MSIHIHDGHRERMRARIEKNGIMDLQPHEVLEYLLYSFVPRKDTNELAHRLLNEFGSLYNVMYADLRLLKEVTGMTENAALFLHVLPDVFHRFLAEVRAPKKDDKYDSDKRSVKVYMGSLIFNSPAETVCIAALDVHEKMIACDIISSGGSSEVRLDVKTIVDYAQKHKAFGIVLAHNHPNGNINPSTADMSITYEISSTLNSLGFRLLEHYIFCGNEVYSFKDHGHIQYFMEMHSSLKEGVWIKKK